MFFHIGLIRVVRYVEHSYIHTLEQGLLGHTQFGITHNKGQMFRLCTEAPTCWKLTSVLGMHVWECTWIWRCLFPMWFLQLRIYQHTLSSQLAFLNWMFKHKCMARVSSCPEALRHGWWHDGEQVNVPRSPQPRGRPTFMCICMSTQLFPHTYVSTQTPDVNAYIYIYNRRQ